MSLVAAAMGGRIDDDAIYKSTQTVKPEQIQLLINTALKGDFAKSRKLLEDLLVDYALAGEDLIKQIHKNIFDLQIKERDKVRLVDRVGATEFRMVEGANPRVQLEALLAHFAVVGEEMD